MQATSYHTQACMEAWLNCENLLISIAQKRISYSHRTVRVVNECADICLTALQALKVKRNNISELALLCIGICEECADICERYNDNIFKTCAAICRQCSTAFTPLALNDK
jgi:hypothetical protein